ncbi:MAG: Hsp33 family molecular chaperone HslO [Betaproteobacteria bacterium]|nr:Hsp33 family molecular chaperone HslO [Betaproteobacteria bacterium]
MTPVRGHLVHLDATWRAVLERHDYPPALRALLGELMAAGALLSSTLKFDGALVMQMQGSGPVTLVVVEVNSEGTLRATAKWQGDLEESTLHGLLGTGRFVISLVPGDGGQPYQGVVELEGDTVAAVLEHYMQKSEQLETRLWLACDDRQAAGMLLQKMPSMEGADEDAWNRVTHLGATVSENELLRLPARELIRRLFHEEDVRVFEASPLAFRCSCSRERVTGMLRTLGRDEVRSILDERGKVEVTCEFCHKRYVFDTVDAEQVFASDLQTQAGSTRH